MAEMANSTIQAIQDQQHSLTVVMDNWVTLDYLLAEQGRVCVTSKTSCCVYINNAGKVKKELEKTHIQVEWSSSVNPQSLLYSFFDFFSWLNPNTLGSYLRATFQGGLIILLGRSLVALTMYCLSWAGRLCEAGITKRPHQISSTYIFRVAIGPTGYDVLCLFFLVFH